MVSESAAGGAGAPRPSSGAVPDRVLGVVGAAMAMAALLLLLFGGPGDGDGAVAPSAAPPVLTILAPAEGAAVEAPLLLRFTADGPIARTSGGWGIGEFHLHAEIAGRELMPGPTDLRRLEANLYEWTLAPLPPGSQTVRLLWSDAAHRPLRETATPAVRVIVR